MNSVTKTNGLAQSLASVKESGGVSADYGAVLRRYWMSRKDELFAQHRSGRAISEGLSAAMDDIVAGLAELVCDSGTALLATGGYGRGQLAPYSDVDLLILADGKEHEARLAPFLYAMWDGGFPLSHSAHTVATAMQAAQDMVTRSAFLDARFIHGDQKMADDFLARYDKLRKRTIPEFIEYKLKERDDRHETAQASRYSIEPDVKEGKGALRDLDTLHWLDRYVTGLDVEADEDPDLSSLLNQKEVRRLRKLEDFFWSVRVQLHDIVGRKDEKLKFALQPGLAERLGYKSRGRESAVERFMRHYFLNAKEVGRLTGTACAQLEERALKETQLARRIFGAVGRIAQEHPFDGEECLVARGGRLDFFEPPEEGVSILNVFKLFRAMGRHNLQLHPEAIQASYRAARYFEPHDHDDPELAKIFRQILTESQHLETTLRYMSETGVLGRYLPGFGGVIGKIEYGLFRQYTLDEHILRSVGVLNDMLHDRDDGRFKLTKPMAKAFGDPIPLYMALLLQETRLGLAKKSKSALRARVREQAMQVLENKTKASQVVFAVSHRDLLVRTASRRNVTDPRLLETICEEVDTERKLALLAITTSCIHRTAGIRSWEEYAKRDVRLLVESIRSFQSGGLDGLGAFLEERRQALRAQARAMLAPEQVPVFDKFIESTPSTFWSMADVSAAADLATLAARLEKEGRRGGAIVQSNAGGILQVIIYSDDRPKLFADFAGVVAEVGGTVFGASAFPLASDAKGIPKAGTIFQINRAGPEVKPFDATPEECERIAARFDEIANGKGSAPTIPPPMIGDRRSVFSVKPTIRTDNEASDEALIVEVEALDRPGLLYHLAGGLAEIGVSIQFAFVATYGHLAVDTFYLQDAPGYKIVDDRRIETIKRQILRVLKG